MSKYECKIDNHDVICPYCDYRYQCEAEDYCEEGTEEECEGCGKIYHRNTDFSVSHTATPDCELNDTRHKWEPKSLGNTDWHDFCSVCDTCRPLPAGR